jgi:hypothetical protein
MPNDPDVPNAPENAPDALQTPANGTCEGVAIENADEFPPALHVYALANSEDFV